MSIERAGPAQAAQGAEAVKPKPPTIAEATDKLIDEMAKKGFEKVTFTINGKPATFNVPGDKAEVAKYLEGNFNSEVFNQGQVTRHLDKVAETVKMMPKQTGKDDELNIPIKRVITR